MNLVIQGSANFSVSENIKDHISKRLEKLNYFKNHIKEINFHLDTEKHDFKIDVTVSVNKLGVLKFQAIDKSIYETIDKIIHKIDVKINREKSKIQDHAKATHEDLVEFYYEHEKNTAEPTIKIEVPSNALSLSEAFNCITKDNHDFIGFYSAENNSLSFLRKSQDDVLNLLKKKSDTLYSEFSLKLKGSSIEVEKEVREIILSKQSLLDAQKNILEQDYNYSVYIDSAINKPGLLYKEDNGKWKLIY